MLLAEMQWCQFIFSSHRSQAFAPKHLEEPNWLFFNSKLYKLRFQNNLCGSEQKYIRKSMSWVQSSSCNLVDQLVYVAVLKGIGFSDLNTEGVNLLFNREGSQLNVSLKGAERKFLIETQIIVSGDPSELRLRSKLKHQSVRRCAVVKRGILN